MNPNETRVKFSTYRKDCFACQRDGPSTIFSKRSTALSQAKRVPFASVTLSLPKNSSAKGSRTFPGHPHERIKVSIREDLTDSYNNIYSNLKSRYDYILKTQLLSERRFHSIRFNTFSLFALAQTIIDNHTVLCETPRVSRQSPRDRNRLLMLRLSTNQKLYPNGLSQSLS